MVIIIIILFGVKKFLPIMKKVWVGVGRIFYFNNLM